MRARYATAAFVAGMVIGGMWSAPLAQGTRSTWDGVYTEAQATRGAELFDRECAQCHGSSGAGGSMAPALVGPAFSANYDGQTVGDLFERNRMTMPIGKEGQLSGQQNADITAFMLQVNAFPAGATELPTQSMMLKQIRYVAERSSGPQQGDRPPGTHQDNTTGAEWIKRLERPDRIPGLKIADVVKSLNLRPGDVIADIGAGTGAFTIPFAQAVAPSGRAFAVDIWPELLDYVAAKAKTQAIANLHGIVAARDDPRLPPQQVDVAFFHDVLHNVNDRQGYLKVLATALKPDARIAIVEQEFDDPIAKKWDLPEDRITRNQVAAWMTNVGFQMVAEFDIFQGANNPSGAGMPERWFVVYQRSGSVSLRSSKSPSE
jgi:mono/diheme cytochrome c family protein/SAM-dependent methyltransferase